MEVRPGYRQTEVGMVPSDWEVVTLGNCLDLLTDFEANGSFADVANNVQVFDHESFAWYVRATDLENQSPMSEVRYVDKRSYDFLRKTALHGGEVLITKRGEIGKVYLFQMHSIPATLAPNLYLLKLNSRALPEYVYYFFRHGIGNRTLKAINASTTLGALYKNDVKGLHIPFPPTKAEQEAIAEALSDADALIESLEQLLTKKRLIKQGALQELLRPKASDDVRLLGYVSSLKGRIGWQGLNQAEFTANVDEPFLITGMNFKDGSIRWDEVYHISQARYEMAPEIQLRADDVLMTKDGTIGKVLFIDTIPYPGRASLNSHLLLFRPIGARYHPRYLYYQLSSRRFKDFVELSKSGTTFFGLSQAAVAAYPVLIPPMEEQVRIATILGDMDTEIVALELKLAKARQLKQGMMQELLTGRIRLV
jgi:type I restriction enzyme S subunit